MITGKYLFLLFLGLVVHATPSIARVLVPTIVSLAEGNDDLAIEEENPLSIHVSPIDLNLIGPLPIQQGENEISVSLASELAEAHESEHKHHPHEPHHKEHHKPHAPPPEEAEAPESEHKHKHKHKHKHHPHKPHHKRHHKSHAPPPGVAEAPHSPLLDHDALEA